MIKLIQFVRNFLHDLVPELIINCHPVLHGWHLAGDDLGERLPVAAVVAPQPVLPVAALLVADRLDDLPVGQLGLGRFDVGLRVVALVADEAVHEVVVSGQFRLLLVVRREPHLACVENFRICDLET